MTKLTRRDLVAAMASLSLAGGVHAKPRRPLAPKPEPAPAGPDTFGVDHMYYPGDRALDTLWQAFNYKIVCFYLSHSAQGSDPSWSRAHRESLAHKGWGFFPTYIGRQEKAPTLAAAKVDAKHAADLMDAAGFLTGSVLYLDVEDDHSGASSEPFRAYVQAWQDGIRQRGYNPGIYGPYTNVDWFTQLTKAVWTVELPFPKRLLAKKMSGLKSNENPKSLVKSLYKMGQLGYDPNKDKYGKLRPGCIATQYIFNVEFPLDNDGATVTVDLNNSLVRDPSDYNQILAASSRPRAALLL